MGFFGWMLVIIVVLVIIGPVSGESEKVEQEKRLAEAPLKLSAILKEEFPSFSGDITTVKCGLICDKIVSNEKLIRKTHDSNGNLKKNEKSISAVRDFSINELAPLISRDFQLYAETDPETFFSSFYKAIELSA